MPNSSARRATKRSSVTRPTPAVLEREPRGARRKRETRTRLLQAALELMAEKGMEGVAINEITEAADVGFGSFYNHFESKEAIHAALLESVFEEFADELDRLLSGIADPAEIISVSVRRTLLRASEEPLWGQFLVREGLSERNLNAGLGRRLLRDVQKGIDAKRFNLADPLMSFITAAGTVLSAIGIGSQLSDPQAQSASPLKALGFSAEHLPERTAAAVLHTLGLARAEAEKIAHRPWPTLDSPAAARESGVHKTSATTRAVRLGATRGKRSNP
jgi:AcrR family transcriptional regulator